MLCYRCGSHVPDGSSKCGTCGQAFTVRGRRPSGPDRPKRKAADDAPGAYRVGERVADRYEVKSIVGQGPVGAVYRAIDREVDVEVAVKVITAKLLQSKEEREAFRLEARLVRALSHPNCVRVYEDGFDGERPYLVMQYLEGLSLRKIIDLRHGKGQRFTLEEIAPIFQQICAALDHAHRLKVGDQNGIAHGHVKPQNVIVLPDLLKVVDFREACYIPRVPFVATQRVRGGEVAYLAPEVVSGQPVAAAADLYGLGVLLGEMLAGELHENDHPLDLQSRDDVPPAMDMVVRRLVAPRPEDRYRRVGEVLDDVLAVVAGEVPPHAGAMRPNVAPARPTDAEVLESGEFELLDDGDEPVGLEVLDEGDGLAEIDDLDGDDLDATLDVEDDGVPTMVAPVTAPGDDDRDFTDPVGGGVRGQEVVDAGHVVRGRETFGLEDEEPEPVPLERPVDSSRSDGRRRPRKNTDEFAAELFGDIGSDADLDDDDFVEDVATELPTADGGSLDEDLDSEVHTVAARRGPSRGRVARPLEETDAPEARLAGRGPDLATDPDGDDGPQTLVSERVSAGEERGGWGAGRFVAVVAVSALAGLAAAIVISEDVRVAIGIAERPGAAQPAPTPPVADAGTTPDSDDGADPTGPPDEDDTQDAPVSPATAKADAGTKDTAAGGRTPGGRSPGTRPDRTPDRSKTVTKTQRDPTPPPPTKTTGRDETSGDGDRRVAAVTPQPGGEPRGENRCPDGMVFVGAGSFQLGSAINDPMRNFAEHALSNVNVGSYCIDRYEYGGRGRRPVVGVTWYRAKELCEARGRRLCTEEEWEKACKGPRNHRFPYGNSFDADACNTEDASGNPRDVAAGGSFNRCRSGYGVFDMAGNVAEWTASRFQPGLQDRTHKGGAANRPDWDTRCATRGNRPPNARDPFLGFRCCADPR